MSWTARLASSLGSPESGLKLVLGQLAGYPLLLLYRKHLASQPAPTQHLFFFLSGLGLAHWVVGEGVVHSLYTIAGTYLLLLAAGGTLLSVVLSLLFNMAYLMAGYWYMAGEEYDISWTMPQCVLCLRLIGLTWDVYDGARARREPDSLSPDQVRSKLDSVPGLLEMLGHSFFIGGYFVGPQFPLAKYRQMAAPGYQTTLPPGQIRFGLARLGLSVAYMTVHLAGSAWLPDQWPTSSSYSQTSLPARLLLLPLWCKFILAKYLSMWLMAEGVCSVAGLSYCPGKGEGEESWNGCANVKLRRLESATKFGHYIEAFNINTNSWVMNYVYKRLRFLNNKHISQLSALAFLAVWHGWHSGYYLTFFNEFIVVNFEREFGALWAKSKKVGRWRDHPAYQTVTSILGWTYVHFWLPHCFLPFPLLTANRYLPAYAGLLGLHFLFFLGWLGWGRLAAAWLLSENTKLDQEEGRESGKAAVVAKEEEKIVAKEE